MLGGIDNLTQNGQSQPKEQTPEKTGRAKERNRERGKEIDAQKENETE